MRSVIIALVLGGLALGAAGCGKPSSTSGAGGARQMPDFGGVKTVEKQADGVGPNRNAAILDALNLAVQETNGSPILGVSVNSNGSLATQDGKGDNGITNDTVMSLTRGVVKSFDILSEGQPGGVWRVRVKAKLNVYEGAGSDKLPKVAIAAPRTHVDSFVIGDDGLSASDVRTAIKSILGDSIGNSKRFAVINRTFSDEVNAELDHATDGNANPAELAKLGQQLTADILIIPDISRLEYRKSTRTLRYSGRELRAYSGGVEMSFNVVNVATGRTILTKTFSADFPETPPTVYGAQRVGISNVKEYLARFADSFTRSFIQKNFPISIVKMDGQTVVLSQGEPMLKVGDVYQAVLLGEDLKDPQTGQSLGRMESPIGSVQVTKTTDSMAFGTFSGSLGSTQFKPGAIELREAAASPAPVAAETPPSAPTASTPAPPSSATSGAAKAALAKAPRTSARPKPAKSKTVDGIDEF